MDLEKAYDKIDRDAMWRVLSMYGINEKLLKVVQSLDERSEACVSVCREEDEWFRVGVGLRQGCVMSPWLFKRERGRSNFSINRIAYVNYFPNLPLMSVDVVDNFLPCFPSSWLLLSH